MTNLPVYGSFCIEFPFITVEENIIVAGDKELSAPFFIIKEDGEILYKLQTSPSFVFVHVKFFFNVVFSIANERSIIPVRTSVPPKSAPFATLRIIFPSFSVVAAVFSPSVTPFGSELIVATHPILCTP